MSAQLVSVLLTGAGTGLGLIVAIGAQNAWVLRQGIRREHIGTVIALCAVADMALIALGTAGIGALTAVAPWLLTVLRWGGVLYLVGFALRSFRSAVRPGRLEAEAPASARSVVLTTLALTFLNPHVYLDTVLMVGGSPISSAGCGGCSPPAPCSPVPSGSRRSASAPGPWQACSTVSQPGGPSTSGWVW